MPYAMPYAPLRGGWEIAFLILFTAFVGLVATFLIRAMIRRPRGLSPIEQERLGLDADEDGINSATDLPDA